MLHADSYHAGYEAGYADALNAVRKQIAQTPKPTGSHASKALADAAAARRADFQGVANL